jgi:hypothetical protein
MASFEPVVCHWHLLQLLSHCTKSGLEPSHFPSIASEASLNLAELSEAENPASKEALTFYRNVIELDKRQDMRNYAHYRSAWIERNLEKWNDAIASLKEAMFDAKGQLKEEVVSDLLTFHAMSSIPAEQALAYFQASSFEGLFPMIDDHIACVTSVAIISMLWHRLELEKSQRQSLNVT